MLLILHIIGGFTALVSGFIASISLKGGNRHRRSGRYYLGSMTVVFLTAVALGALKEKWFLFMVGFFSYYMVVRGYRILHLKKLGAGQTAGWLDWSIAVAGGAFGLSLIGWSLLAEQKSFSAVPMIFGLICTGFAAKDLQLFIRGPKHKNHWIFGHIAGMGGGYIATWTAFLVTNVHFLPPVVVWLAPSVVGSICISLSIRHYQRKQLVVG